MVFERVSDGQMFERSEALFELSRALGGVWRILLIGRMIPRRCRDAAYDVLARNRHRLMGPNPVCTPDEPAIRNRWLD